MKCGVSDDLFFDHVIPIHTNVSMINPYSSALVGLIAGLFTERAYRLLSKLVDEVSERVVKGEP